MSGGEEGKGLMKQVQDKVNCLPWESSKSSEAKMGDEKDGNNGKLGVCLLGSEESRMISEQNASMMRAE